MFVYLASRDRDCDGTGWSFYRFDIEPSVLEAYIEAVIDWEHTRARAIDAYLTLCGIEGGREDGAATRAVNSCMFDSSADKVIEVGAKYDIMQRRLVFVSEEIAKHADKYGSRPSISECDVVGGEEFESRYLPMLRNSADADWKLGYFEENGYTSIFNGN